MSKASVVTVLGAFCIVLLAWGASAQFGPGSASAPALLGAEELDSMMGGVCNNQKMRTKTCKKDCAAGTYCKEGPGKVCMMAKETPTWECYGDANTKDYHCTQTSTDKYCAYIYAGPLPYGGECASGDCGTQDVKCGDAATAAQQQKCPAS